jgi:hypothetical protein
MTLRALLLVTILTTPLFAAERRARDTPLDAKTRDQAIASALALIDKEYVFPDGAKQLVQAIHAQQQRGAYNKITSSIALAEALTHDLHAAVNDQHLGV